MNMMVEEQSLRANVAGRSIGAILMDSGILTPEGAERILRLQKEKGLRFGEAAIQLGLLAESDLQYALSKQFDYAYLPASGEKPVSEELIAAYQPFSQRVEQLRALRSQLMMRWFDRDANSRKVLAVVGAERKEGRSYLIANLAIVFSQLGERTLVIDADMRNPRQHELFRQENKVGLSTVLSGRTDRDGIVRIPSFENLSILPGGAVPPNPQELINRPAFGSLLDMVSGRFDVVLVDTPATSTAADAALIALRAGAAVVVARKNQTRLSSVAELINSFANSGVVMVGSVLNSPLSSQAAA